MNYSAFSVNIFELTCIVCRQLKYSKITTTRRKYKKNNFKKNTNRKKKLLNYHYHYNIFLKFCVFFLIIQILINFLFQNNINLSSYTIHIFHI